LLDPGLIRFVDGFLCALTLGAAFKLRRTDLAERGMPPPLVIEPFDAVRQRHLGLAAAGEALAFLALHRRKEALHHGVVVTIHAVTHAAPPAMHREEAKSEQITNAYNEALRGRE
jgi:hypothetical protein